MELLVTTVQEIPTTINNLPVTNNEQSAPEPVSIIFPEEDPIGGVAEITYDNPPTKYYNEEHVFIENGSQNISSDTRSTDSDYWGLLQVTAIWVLEGNDIEFEPIYDPFQFNGGFVLKGGNVRTGAPETIAWFRSVSSLIGNFEEVQSERTANQHTLTATIKFEPALQADYLTWEFFGMDQVIVNKTKKLSVLIHHQGERPQFIPPTL